MRTGAPPLVPGGGAFPKSARGCAWRPRDPSRAGPPLAPAGPSQLRAHCWGPTRAPGSAGWAALRGSLGSAPNGRSAPGARLRSALTCGRCRPEMLRCGTGSKSGRGEQSPEPPRRRALSPRRANPPLRAPVPSPGLGRRVGAGFRVGGGAGCRLPRQPCARGP